MAKVQYKYLRGPAYMSLLILLPFVIQTVVIMIDEFYFHVRRGLPKWERLGHPLDTLTVLACFAFILLVPYSPFALKIYVALAIFSCVFVTKDEFVHKKCCPASEQWLHALLFLNHPIVLTAAGLIWPIMGGSETPSWLSGLAPYIDQMHTLLMTQTGAIALFFFYQLIYWNILCRDKAPE
jgi:hypothetical protein